MPTSDYYRQQQAWRAETHEPNPGAAMMPSGSRYYDIETVDGGHAPAVYQGGARARRAADRARAASQARVMSQMAAGRSEAALHMWQTARPLSQERRVRRGQWRRAEAQAIEASYFAQAVTQEAVLGQMYGWWD